MFPLKVGDNEPQPTDCTEQEEQDKQRTGIKLSQYILFHSSSSYQYDYPCSEPASV